MSLIILAIIDEKYAYSAFINKPKTSDKKLFTLRHERLIVHQIKIEPRLSALKIRDTVEKYYNITYNPETVQSILRNNAFNRRIAR